MTFFPLGWEPTGNVGSHFGCRDRSLMLVEATHEHSMHYRKCTWLVHVIVADADTLTCQRQLAGSLLLSRVYALDLP
jgi:hypothetical protein